MESSRPSAMAFRGETKSLMPSMSLLIQRLRRFLLLIVPGLLALAMVMIGRSIVSTIVFLFSRDEVTGMASVELWVVVTTLMLVLRFLLDISGPWYADRVMARIIVTIEMLNYSMVHYTLGLMQLSAAGRVNDYFQVWAVLLVTLQYSVKIGRPYSRSKQLPLLDLMSSFWAANLLRVQTFFLLRFPLWLIWSLNAARIISYFSSSDKAEGINQGSCRFIADYMRREHLQLAGSHQEQEDANNPGPRERSAMSGCRYVVLGEEQLLKEFQVPKDRSKEEVAEDVQAQEGHVVSTHDDLQYQREDYKKLITLDKICNVGGGLLSDDETQASTRKKKNWHHPGQLKDVCLSFALYKLLRRRFYNLPVHEARLLEPKRKMRRLVFAYVMEDAERAFRVAATELSFLQDLFYSKHAAMFADGFPAWNTALCVLLVAATGYVAYPVRHIPERLDRADRSRITHGVFITRAIIALIVGKELAEVYVYVFSQWTKVLLLCSYAKHRWMRRWPAVAVIKVLLCFMSRGTRREERIRQHNLLIRTRLPELVQSFIFPWRKFQTGIRLEACTKGSILKSLKRLEDEPRRLHEYFLNSFGEEEKLEENTGAQDRISYVEEFKWAVRFKPDTHKILVWHIATCLCEIDLASDKAAALFPALLPTRPFVKRQSIATTSASEAAVIVLGDHYATAASLSNYCAYLVTQELVPDNGLVARKVFPEVCWEINYVTVEGYSLCQLVLRRGGSMKDVSDRLKRLLESSTSGGQEDVEAQEAPQRPRAREKSRMREDDEDNDDLKISRSLTTEGVKLAEQLIGTFGSDKARLWGKLAEFWTGFLLHLAASTRASKHRARLAGGRELTTQLWALLSHAGFLEGDHGHTFVDDQDQGPPPDS